MKLSAKDVESKDVESKDVESKDLLDLNFFYVYNVYRWRMDIMYILRAYSIPDDQLVILNN